MSEWVTTCKRGKSKGNQWRRYFCHPFWPTKLANGTNNVESLTWRIQNYEFSLHQNFIRFQLQKGETWIRIQSMEVCEIHLVSTLRPNQIYRWAETEWKRIQVTLKTHSFLAPADVLICDRIRNSSDSDRIFHLMASFEFSMVIDGSQSNPRFAISFPLSLSCRVFSTLIKIRFRAL